jgi:Zn-dependent peptidase ImmA (M78 family)
MGISRIKSLKEVRERLLHYDLGNVARLTRISRARLQELEENASFPTVFEAEELARIYGIEGDLLADRPIRLSSKDVLQVFTNLEEFKEVGDFQKAKIIEAANASRELHQLEAFAGYQPRARVVHIAYTRNARPYEQGAEIALKFRRALRSETGPIPSVRDLFRDQLSNIALLYASLGREGPAAIALADSFRPPTVVLNLDGKNENPCVRRFSLAHELCHLVADWKPGQPLGILSGYYSDSALAQEQRANAFAVRFLCPESDLADLPDDPLEAARKLMRHFGLHYSAVRLYLHNERNAELPDEPAAELMVSVSVDRKWEDAEIPNGIFEFPIASVPPERRTRIAALAALLYSRGRIQRDRFAELLRLTPADELEKVLDFFDLDPPEGTVGRRSETNLS